MKEFLAHYLAYSFLYALIASIMVEALIKTWVIRNPLLLVHLRLFLLFVSAFSYPLFSLFFPFRSGEFFSEKIAFFHFLQASQLQYRGFSVFSLMFFFSCFSVLLFLFQELLPAFRAQFEKVHPMTVSTTPNKTTLVLYENDYPEVYARGFFSPKIMLSTGLVRLLDDDELHAVLAHEEAHLQKNDLVKGFFLFLFRLCFAFHPVFLVQMRRLFNDNEKVCDDIAVNSTKDPLALASALIKIAKHKYSMKRIARYSILKKFHRIDDTLENHSMMMLTKERVRRLLDKETQVPQEEKAQYYFTIFAVLTVLFLVL